MNTRPELVNTPPTQIFRVNDVGSSLHNGKDTEALQTAINSCRQRLDAYPQVDAHRAYLMLQLVWALRQLPDRKHIDNLTEAYQWADHALLSLSFLPGQYGSSNWAYAHLQLGNIAADTPVDILPDNLRHALDHYKAALRGYTEINNLSQYASVQRRMGYIYYQMTTGNRSANLQNAADCFENALKFYTKSNNPACWALMQYNLGVVLYDLPVGSRAVSLKRAIGYFKAALTVRNEANRPRQWADTQLRLACAYDALSAYAPVYAPKRAVTSFKRALRGYKKIGEFNFQGSSQYRMAMTLQRSNNTKIAKKAMMQAVRNFRTADDAKSVRMAKRALHEISTG